MATRPGPRPFGRGVSSYDPRAIVVAGSIVRGEGDASCDFDLQVIHGEPWRQRAQRLSHGVPCEIFVNPLGRLRGYFEQEQREGQPCTAHMLATGWVVLDRDGCVREVRAEARSWLDRPPTTTPERLAAIRYGAADQIDNANDVIARDPATAAWLAGAAVEPVLIAWLLGQRRLVPRRKELLATVTVIDPAVGEQARRALMAETPTARVEATAELARRCLGVTGFFAWESAREPC
jgi:hypothetical protein